MYSWLQTVLHRPRNSIFLTSASHRSSFPPTLLATIFITACLANFRWPGVLSYLIVLALLRETGSGVRKENVLQYTDVFNNEFNFYLTKHSLCAYCYSPSCNTASNSRKKRMESNRGKVSTAFLAARILLG